MESVNLTWVPCRWIVNKDLVIGIPDSFPVKYFLDGVLLPDWFPLLLSHDNQMPIRVLTEG